MKDALKRIKRQKNLMVGGTITLLVVAMAVFAPWLAPYDPVDHADLVHSEEPPNR
ncbi:MAG: putative transrane component of transporter, partial [Deltaproteobacteria bacterium]|nr:putative transrane component of transporter [Deltaproteobacteria bacterium]